MGSIIEFNDTLKLKKGDGFPENIEEGKEYRFLIEERRIYHLYPVRVFLVEEIDKMWNFIGQVHIIELTINPIEEKTHGVFRVFKIYSRDYALLLNENDAPTGKGYRGK
jgi:hypothetical protein